ncbi:hypothetical protein D3C81_1057950 [compost metagenome]
MGFRQRLADAFGRMHHAEGVFYRDVLRAAGLQVLLGSAQRRQDQCVLAGDQMATVKLGTDMHRQVAAAQGAGCAFGVRRGGGQVTAQRQQNLHFTTQHGLNRLYGVMARFASRREVKMLFQAV